MDLSVLWKLSYGMYALGVMDGERPTGCIVNTIVQITSENPIIAISVNKDNYTYEVIERTKRLAVSILSEETDGAVIGALGYASGRDTDKFRKVSYRMEQGLPVLEEKLCGYLICDVLAITDCETHGIVLARVADTGKGPAANPMTYQYFHAVIKGKAPKNAPTYQAEKKAEKPQYVCSICGYIYEGDLSREPEDYVCPICGAPKSAFQKK